MKQYSLVVLFIFSLLSNLLAETNVEQKVLKDFSLKYIKSSKLKEFLSEQFKNVIFTADDRLSKIIAICTSSELTNISKFIELLDSKPKQVVISIKATELVIVTSTDFGLNLTDSSFDWKSLFTPYSLTTASIPDLIKARINLFKTDKVDGKLIIDTMLSCESGDSATLKRQTEEPIPTVTSGVGITTTTYTYRPVGFELSISPIVYDNNEILSVIKVSLSSVIGSSSQGAVRFGNNNADTTKRIKDGETTVISGLFQQQNKVSKKGIPILMDIPLLSILFSYEQNEVAISEVILSITLNILKEGEKIEFPKHQEIR
jgi:type II secretory pathway component GspD/PulD (secretin)